MTNGKLNALISVSGIFYAININLNDVFASELRLSVIQKLGFFVSNQKYE